MVWVEFFKVYDSFSKLKSPILYGKAILDGDLKIVPLAEEVTEEIPEALTKIKDDEKVTEKFPYLKDVNLKELKHIPDNNIYGYMIKN